MPFQSSAPQYITLRKHMSSAFQWAPVCAFPSPALAFKVHQRRHRCHHPRPRPVAALPSSPSFAHLPIIGHLFSILKATIQFGREKPSWITMVCFLSQSFCGGLRGCEKLQQNAMETRHRIPLTLRECVCKLAGVL